LSYDRIVGYCRILRLALILRLLMILSPIVVMFLFSLIAGFLTKSLNADIRFFMGFTFVVAIVVSGVLDLVALLLLFNGFRNAYSVHGFLVYKLAFFSSLVLLILSVVSVAVTAYAVITSPAPIYGLAIISRIVFEVSPILGLIYLLVIVVGEIVIYRAFISLGVVNSSSLLVNGGYTGIASVFAFAFIRLHAFWELASIVLYVFAHILLIVGLSRMISQYM